MERTREILERKRIIDDSLECYKQAEGLAKGFPKNEVIRICHPDFCGYREIKVGGLSYYEKVDKIAHELKKYKRQIRLNEENV